MASHQYAKGPSPFPPSYDSATGHRNDDRQRQSAYFNPDQTTLPSAYEPSVYSSPSYDRPHPPHSDTNTSYASSSFAPQYPSRHEPAASDDAVPLRPYHLKRDSQASQAPLTPHYDDPFVRDAKPGRAGRRRPYPDTRPRQGWFKGQITWCCFIFSLVQIAVFIGELIRMGVLTGSPIQTKPSFNPMIGPSPYVLINMGARYQPCMHSMPNVNETISWPCPSTTTVTDRTETCTLAQLCGFGGMNVPPVYGHGDGPQPNQWWRFIVPIFLHAGFIHIGFNLLLQLTLGRDMELAIGSLRFAVVYMSAGIFGFVLGGNFAANGIASTGASGSLFGILALNLLDLLYHWQTRRSPVKDLAFIVLDIAIAFVLGLLPGLDNFSHIGGFLTGLVLGICLLRSPAAFSKKLGEDEPAYDLAGRASPPPNSHSENGMVVFAKRPIGFFKGRKPFWWAWWLVRAGALIGTVVGFIALFQNFYVWHDTCSWCKHLTCIDYKNWCNIGNLEISASSPQTGANSTSPNPAKRDIASAADAVLRAAFRLD